MTKCHCTRPKAEVMVSRLDTVSVSGFRRSPADMPQIATRLFEPNWRGCLLFTNQPSPGRFYTNFRFPAYNYDKMVVGLIDAHRFAGLTQAYRLLDRTTDAAEPHLP